MDEMKDFELIKYYYNEKLKYCPYDDEEAVKCMIFDEPNRKLKIYFRKFLKDKEIRKRFNYINKWALVEEGYVANEGSELTYYEICSKL